MAAFTATRSRQADAGPRGPAGSRGGPGMAMRKVGALLVATLLAGFSLAACGHQGANRPVQPGPQGAGGGPPRDLDAYLKVLMEARRVAIEENGRAGEHYPLVLRDSMFDDPFRSGRHALRAGLVEAALAAGLIEAACGLPSAADCGLPSVGRIVVLQRLSPEEGGTLAGGFLLAGYDSRASGPRLDGALWVVRLSPTGDGWWVSNIERLAVS